MGIQFQPYGIWIRELNVLNGLPVDGVLCHNGFHPNNIIVSLQGSMVIDWAMIDIVV